MQRRIDLDRGVGAIGILPFENYGARDAGSDAAGRVDAVLVVGVRQANRRFQHFSARSFGAISIPVGAEVLIGNYLLHCRLPRSGVCSGFPGRVLCRWNGNAVARTDLGTSYYNLGRADEALREYRQSLEIDPRHQPTLYNMVLVNLEGTHNFAAARQAWERLHGLNPKYPGLDRLKRSLETAEGSRQ